jgi:signal transduction histidine kinase/CheY-like chemotaxis protein
MPSFESVSLTLRLQVTLVAATALLIWRLRRVYGGEALQHLTVGWVLWTLRIAVSIAGVIAMNAAMEPHHPWRRVLTSAAMFLAVGTAAYMQAGTLGVAGIARKNPLRRWVVVVAIGLSMVAVLTTFAGAPMWWRRLLILISSTIVPLVLFGSMGWYLLRAARDDLTTGRQLAGMAYALFAAKQTYNLAEYVRMGAPSAPPSPYSEAIFHVLVAMGTVALLLERERQRSVQAEREQRRLEGELAARDRLDSLGRLAGGVAHDFNNMLTAILGNAQIARARLDEVTAGGPAEDVSEELASIESTATRASALTKQLLAFARRDRIAPVPFDVIARLQRVRQYVTPMFAPPVHFTVAYAPGDLQVRGDPDRIEQAVINLLQNAHDALGGKAGEITLRVDVVPGALDGRDAVRISVSDTGAGMDDTVRAHLFEPFFTTKSAANGTGLGLSIVHGAVTQAGGRIEVESAPGAGTTIGLILPRVEPVAVPAVSDEHRLDGLAGVRVLVVDDDPLVRRVAARILEKQGMRVLEASDAEEGLALHAAQPAGAAVQMLLTDLVMPGANGRTLARLLRGRDPALPVVYMSGYEADTFTDEPDAPVGVFVRKPFTKERLLVAMREALAGAVATA